MTDFEDLPFPPFTDPWLSPLPVPELLPENVVTIRPRRGTSSGDLGAHA